MSWKALMLSGFHYTEQVLVGPAPRLIRLFRCLVTHAPPEWDQRVTVARLHVMSRDDRCRLSTSP